MEKEDFNYFLNKNVGIVYEDVDKKEYVSGILIKISNSSITLVVGATHQLFSISSITKVKEKYSGANNE